MTLQEYLNDYASENTFSKGVDLIDKEIHNIGKEKVKEKTEGYLERIRNGERDFRF